MEIKILQGMEGALRAVGTAVVIDVLRAFTTTCHAMASGAGKIMAVARAETAFGLRDALPDAVLLGERKGIRIPGFDLGNSPSGLRGLDFKGRAVIITTSNGTRGLLAAQRADEILTGSFVNANALVRYIQRENPGTLSLVCMGSHGVPSIEDTLCAQYVQEAVLGRRPDFDGIRQTILDSPRVAAYKAANNPDMPVADLDMCLKIDQFDFILRAHPGPAGAVRLERDDVPRHH